MGTYQWTPDEIRNFRKERRLTQVDLAALIGVSLPTVKRWESGKAIPQDRHLKIFDQLMGPSDQSSFLSRIMREAGETIDVIAHPRRTVKEFGEAMRRRRQADFFWKAKRYSENLPESERVEITLALDRKIIEACERAAEESGIPAERILEMILFLVFRAPKFDFEKHWPLRNDDDET